jgi:hypothetical protein
MLSATISLVLAAAHDSEKSKTPFYLLGGLLVVWAVGVSAFGITRPEFPGKASTMRLVMAVTIVLVLGATISAVATA